MHTVSKCPLFPGISSFRNVLSDQRRSSCCKLSDGNLKSNGRHAGELYQEALSFCATLLLSRVVHSHYLLINRSSYRSTSGANSVRADSWIRGHVKYSLAHTLISSHNVWEFRLVHLLCVERGTSPGATKLPTTQIHTLQQYIVVQYNSSSSGVDDEGTYCRLQK